MWSTIRALGVVCRRDASSLRTVDERENGSRPHRARRSAVRPPRCPGASPPRHHHRRRGHVESANEHEARNGARREHSEELASSVSYSDRAIAASSGGLRTSHQIQCGASFVA